MKSETDNEKGYYGFSVQTKHIKIPGNISMLERMFKSLFGTMYEEGILASELKEVTAEIRDHDTADGNISYLDVDFYFNK